jgi:hypothetical protein
MDGEKAKKMAQQACDEEDWVVVEMVWGGEVGV